MGIKPSHRFFKATAVFLFASILVLFFQNCGGSVRFSDLKQYSNGVPIEPGSYTTLVGSTSFPPLKLIMVLDNSASMEIHNNNLSAPLAAMFNSANSGNLSQFDTTLYVITTAQSSLDTRYYPATTVDPVQLAGLSLSAVNSLYRDKTLSFTMNSQPVTITNGITGELPGDILGYRINQSGVPSALTTSFKPAPMLFLNSSVSGVIANSGLFIPKGSNPTSIQSTLAQQLDQLTYKRRDFKFDNNTDGPVNKESGLCAVARVLKHNQNIINPGDMVSFLIASDEADNDPAGLKCIDSTTVSDGTTDYYDGECRGTRFNFEKHSCSFSYWSGYYIDYKYNYLPMNVSYKIETTIQLGDGYTDVVLSDKTAVIDSTGLSCSNTAAVIAKLPPPGPGVRILSINSCSIDSVAVSKTGSTFSLLFNNLLSGEPALGSCLSDKNILDTILTKNSAVGSISAINYCNVTKRTDYVTQYPGAGTCADILNAQCTTYNSSRRNCTTTSDTYIADRKDDPLRGGLSCLSLASDTSIFTSQPGTVDNVITQTYFGRNCSPQPYASSTYRGKLVDYLCPAGTTKVVTKGPYQVSGTQTDFVAGTTNAAPKSDLVTYIKNQSQALLGSTTPHISVFDDTAITTHYDTLVSALGGIESSISATSYSGALNNLSYEISKRLARSIQVPKMVAPIQSVKQVRKNGVPLIPITEWTSSGNTVTINDVVLLQIGDQITIDYE